MMPSVRGLFRIAALMSVTITAACGEVEPKPAAAPPTSASDVVGHEATAVSTATVFGLAPRERADLERAALAGDGEASFRLALFYGMAGGEDGGVHDEDGQDALKERRWLELAAEQGHESGKFNLAVLVAKTDCPRARRMMEQIVRETGDSDTRRSGTYWLEDSRFDC